MTYEEAKNQVANNNYFRSWEDFLMIEGDDENRLESLLSDAADIYARSKWDEACEACAELACVDNIGTDGEAYILNHKPEFKP